jgi:uncharacterized protein YdeI (YjbR/CyaY-like superfamily)
MGDHVTVDPEERGMKVDEFRRLALELPEAVESAHMGHPDFRVRGKIFATLGHPAQGWGMVKLNRDQQELFIGFDPEAFVAVAGAWGRRGATSVKLGAAPRRLVREALAAAWHNTAPPALARQDAKPTFFAGAAEFRAWLERHHRDSPELLVGLRKGRAGLGWSEAVDQALCFGWIDGVRKRLDERSYTVRVTPRRPGSTWSASNIERVAKLRSRGLMRPAGLAAFERRVAEKSRTYSYEQAEPAALDPALEKLLRARKEAWAHFQEQAPSYRRKVVHWIMAAKSDETRAKRLHRLIEAASRGRRL